MEANQNKKFSYKQMQENLPDFVFGRLSNEDSKIFERTLPDYPDLVEEVEQVRQVFQRVEDTDFNADIERKARNVSVKVRQKMDMKKSRLNQGVMTRLVIPALSFAFIAVVAFMTILDSDDPTIAVDGNDIVLPEALSKIENIIKPAEALLIIDSTTTSETLSDLASKAEVSSLIPNSGELEEAMGDDTNNLIDELMAYEILSDISSENESNILTNMYSDSYLEDTFNYMEENEFQQLLEDLDNADFES